MAFLLKPISNNDNGGKKLCHTWINVLASFDKPFTLIIQIINNRIV